MLAAILLAAFAAYAPTLNSWFASDDFWFLRAGQTSSFGEYFVRVFDPRETGAYPELNRYRPLYALAWWLQYQAFGLNAMPYHAVVMGLYLVCVVMAWWLFRRLLGPGAAANFATMIFALHPAYAEAIAWLSGGNRVFAVAPALGALLLYLKAGDSGQPRLLLLAGSLVLSVVAILMHSSMVVLAPVIAACTFLVQGEPRDALRWRNWVHLAPFLAVAAVSVAVQWWVRDHVGIEEGFSLGFHIYSNYASYFALILVPVRTTASDAVDNAKLIASVVVIATLIAIAYRRPFWGLGLFAILWLLASLLPDTTFLIGGFGRVMYNAAAPIALLSALAVIYAASFFSGDVLARARSIAPVAFVVLAVVLAAGAYARTRSTTGDAAEYRSFADALRAEVSEVPKGGAIYVSGAHVTAFTPESQITSLVQMYLGDVDVRVIAPGAAPPVLGPNDVWFVHHP
jgi:hypothetical protein